MWGKLGTWAINAILIPLFTKLGEYIIKKIKFWLENREIAEKNKEKIKKFKEAKNENDIIDAYNKLP